MGKIPLSHFLDPNPLWIHTQVRIQEKDIVSENICRLHPQACKIGLNLWMASGFTFFKASNCSRMIFLKLEISKNTAKMNQRQEHELTSRAEKKPIWFILLVDILACAAWIVPGCVGQLGRKIA
jgi:hypothetical protein